MRTHWPVHRHLLLRGARLWALVRLSLGVILIFMEASPIAISMAATLWTVVVSVGLGFIDARRMHELALLANLGLSAGHQALPLALAAVLGEIGVRALVAL